MHPPELDAHDFVTSGGTNIEVREYATYIVYLVLYVYLVWYGVTGMVWCTLVWYGVRGMEWFLSVITTREQDAHIKRNVFGVLSTRRFHTATSTLLHPVEQSSFENFLKGVWYPLSPTGTLGSARTTYFPVLLAG